MSTSKIKFTLDLFEEIEKCDIKNVENENYCYITGNVVEPTNLAVIKPCGHKFDKVALKNAFDAEARFMAKPGKICPYCRVSIKSIKNNFNSTEKVCSYIFKKGKCKGQCCCCKVFENSPFCKKHTKA